MAGCLPRDVGGGLPGVRDQKASHTPNKLDSDRAYISNSRLAWRGVPSSSHWVPLGGERIGATGGGGRSAEGHACDEARGDVYDGAADSCSGCRRPTCWPSKLRRHTTGLMMLMRVDEWRLH